MDKLKPNPTTCYLPAGMVDELSRISTETGISTSDLIREAARIGLPQIPTIKEEDERKK